MRVSLVFYVLATLAFVELKQFDRCDLAFELIRQGMDKVGSLRDWVCLIEGESARSTAAVNTNANGSKDWGLYQINDKYWCSSGTPGKDCGIRCEDLLLDDISIASKCARLIFRRHQFTAWVAWRKHCQDPAALPDLQKECNILST